MIFVLWIHYVKRQHWNCDYIHQDAIRKMGKFPNWHRTLCWQMNSFRFKFRKLIFFSGIVDAHELKLQRFYTHYSNVQQIYSTLVSISMYVCNMVCVNVGYLPFSNQLLSAKFKTEMWTRTDTHKWKLDENINIHKTERKTKQQQFKHINNSKRHLNSRCPYHFLLFLSLFSARTPSAMTISCCCCCSCY